ncbi:MAG TPA: carboxymuconolactone decarboxylase family protein [Streptosporangiaceae bacterium]|jgi:4-carboxymuconolactone decarboxylase
MSVSDDLFGQGERIRRQVLGDEHVDRSLANASEFGRPLQELVTTFCWGATWGRPGLELKTRSLLNLAMLTALDRQTELAVHIKGALNNGCTVDEIRETLLQTAVYCGVPAAIEAFRTAERVLDTAAANGQAPGRAGPDGAGAGAAGADAASAGDTAVEA